MQRSCLPGLLETGTLCVSDNQCGESELCLQGPQNEEAQCFEIVGHCTPRCSGDFDCSSGYCDPKSGECVEEEPTGRSFGEHCTQDGQCRGSCVEFEDGTSECEERCRVGAASGCGFPRLEESGVFCAYFAFDLSAIEFEQGSGDTGICASLCGCDGDCPDDQRCYPIETQGYRGICTGGLNEDEGILCGGAGGGN